MIWFLIFSLLFILAFAYFLYRLMKPKDFSGYITYTIDMSKAETFDADKALYTTGILLSSYGGYSPSSSGIWKLSLLSPTNYSDHIVYNEIQLETIPSGGFVNLVDIFPGISVTKYFNGKMSFQGNVSDSINSQFTDGSPFILNNMSFVVQYINSISIPFSQYTCQIDLSLFSDFKNLILQKAGGTSPISLIENQYIPTTLSLYGNPTVSQTQPVNKTYNVITSWSDLQMSMNVQNTNVNIYLSQFLPNQQINITQVMQYDPSILNNANTSIPIKTVLFNINNSENGLQNYTYYDINNFFIVNFNLENLSVFIQNFANVNYGSYLSSLPFISNCNDYYNCIIAGGGPCDATKSDLLTNCANSNYILENVLTCNLNFGFPLCPSSGSTFCNLPEGECINTCIDEDAEGDAGACMLGCGLPVLLALSTCKT